MTGPDITLENSFGMWAGKDGALRLIARNGDEAPETGGALFGHILSQAAVLNARGQVAFHADLTGPGVTEANRWGIWAHDLSGVLRLIVRSGDSIEVAPGDFRIAESFGFGFIIGTGNEDGHPGGFNDLGQLAFGASFTDGTSGIFVSDLATVPEPSSLLLVVSATLALFLRTRRS